MNNLLPQILERLDQMRAVEQAATAGEWEVERSRTGALGIIHLFQKPNEQGHEGEHVILPGAAYLDDEDATFIAASRTDWPKTREALRVALSALSSIHDVRRAAGMEDTAASDALQSIAAILGVKEGGE